MVDHAAQIGSTAGPSSCVEPPLRARRPARAGRAAPTRAAAARPGSRRPARAPSCVAQLAQAAAGQLGVAVGGEPQAEPELGVVLEQRVRPRRAAPVGVDRPRRGRQVAAVDRRAAGRVGDRQPVAEQLREELQIRRLAAPRAGAGELEQRLEELGAAHGAEVHPRAVVRPAAARRRRCSRARLASSGSRASRLIALRPGSLGRGHRARLDAQPAAGAVLDVHLQRVAGVREPGCVERRRPEADRARRPGGPDRSSGSESRCAGRRSCSCRTGCRARSPRPRPARRCCASRTRSCRSDRCRRPAAR